MFFTYFPNAFNKNLTESFVLLCVKGIFVTLLGNDRLRIACKSPCGAISIAIASSGICLEASSNKTCPKRLLVWYSGELVCANSLSHSDSGMELLIHFDERGFDSGMTFQ